MDNLFHSSTFYYQFLDGTCKFQSWQNPKKQPRHYDSELEPPFPWNNKKYSFYNIRPGRNCQSAAKTSDICDFLYLFRQKSKSIMLAKSVSITKQQEGTGWNKNNERWSISSQCIIKQYKPKSSSIICFLLNQRNNSKIGEKKTKSKKVGGDLREAHNIKSSLMEHLIPAEILEQCEAYPAIIY